MNKVLPKKETFERDWQTSFGKQMPQKELPDFKNLWRKAYSNFKELMELLENR